MKVIAILPARMAASRFPGKPLTKILGYPMIEHVRRRVELMPFIDEVVVATCDEEIQREVESHGGKVVMTSRTHERATDRINEAAGRLGKAAADRIIVNVQGDEPMVSHRGLEALIAPFRSSPETLSTCLVYPIRNPADLSDLNVVKTVLSKSNRMLYLSRAGIPGKSYNDKTPYYKQSGLMAYRQTFLEKYSALPPTPLEAQESVDVLRILENDLWMQGVVFLDETQGVDVPEHVARIEKAILGNPQEKAIFEKIFKK